MRIHTGETNLREIEVQLFRKKIDFNSSKIYPDHMHTHGRPLYCTVHALQRGLANSQRQAHATVLAAPGAERVHTGMTGLRIIEVQTFREKLDSSCHESPSAKCARTTMLLKQLSLYYCQPMGAASLPMYYCFHSATSFGVANQFAFRALLALPHPKKKTSFYLK